MAEQKHRRWVRSVGRLACIAIAAVTLAGCVVAPGRVYHPWPRYYY